MFEKRTFSRIVLLVLAVTVLTGSVGCSRFMSPRTKLKYDVYSPEEAMTSGGQYLIGVRDELEIAVWRCPELARTVTVRPEDGMIMYPLLGDVKAAGLTPKELALSISKKLAYYVKEPKVAVGVKKFGEKKVFIMGEVILQGSYRLERGDRILDLIAKAGGFTDNAITSCTYIVRGGYDDSKIVRVNIGRLLHKGDVSQNVYLQEGDMVYVPESELENLNYALRKIFPSMYFAEKLADLQQDIMAGGFDWSDVWKKMGDSKGN